MEDFQERRNEWFFKLCLFIAGDFAFLWLAVQDGIEKERKGEGRIMYNA
jgi:hypothetical protein